MQICISLHPNLLAQNGFFQVWQSLCFNVVTSTFTYCSLSKAKGTKDRPTIYQPLHRAQKKDIIKTARMKWLRAITYWCFDPPKRLTIEGNCSIISLSIFSDGSFRNRTSTQSLNFEIFYLMNSPVWHPKLIIHAESWDSQLSNGNRVWESQTVSSWSNISWRKGFRLWLL